MDPNQGPPQRPSRQDQHNGQPSTSSAALEPPPVDGSDARSRSLSPASTGRGVLASTPAAQSEANTEYFPPLEPEPSVAPSVAPSVTPSMAPSSMGPRTSRMRSASNVSAESAPAEPLRQPSIRIRRRRSSARSARPDSASSDTLGSGIPLSSSLGADIESSGRQRSISQPERVPAIPDGAATTRARHSRRAPPVAMPRLTEEGARPRLEDLGIQDGPNPPAPTYNAGDDPDDLDGDGAADGPQRLQRMRTFSRFFWPRSQSQQAPDQERTSRDRTSSERPPSRINQGEYDERLVDYLDTIDPEVQTLSTLTNVQNSLFIPDLGRWVNRRPTYTLSEHDYAPPATAGPTPTQEPPADQEPPQKEEPLGQIGEDAAWQGETGVGPSESRPGLYRSNTITSRLTDSHYAALPHGTTLEGWTAEEKWELDDHVRHMMHSRRSKFKRSMKGFGQYVRRPLGFFVTLYATLITLFGLAWVLFLIGWIYVGDKQVYAIHVIDSVLVALFAIMGDGLAPFRAIDTYHMAFVVHYARIVKKKRKQQARAEKEACAEGATPDASQLEEGACPPSGIRGDEEEGPTEPLRSPDAASVHSHNPNTMRNNIVDEEDTKSGIEAYEHTPLTYAQQKKLHHHQKKLAKSHSFYKPQETDTHYAFPIKYLIAIVVLLDCHSCLQISLGACTWGIDYRTRPFALTTVILCISITCNITAGVIISVGGRKTRKKDVWLLMTRQELTSDAMKAIEHKRSDHTGKSPDRAGGGESDVDSEKPRLHSASATSSLASRLTSRRKKNKTTTTTTSDGGVGGSGSGSGGSEAEGEEKQAATRTTA